MSFWRFLSEFAIFNLVCNWFSGKSRQDSNLISKPKHDDTDNLQERIDMLESRLDDCDIMSEEYDRIEDKIDALQNQIDEIEEIEERDEDLMDELDELDDEIEW